MVQAAWRYSLITSPRTRWRWMGGVERDDGVGVVVGWAVLGALDDWLYEVINNLGLSRSERNAILFDNACGVPEVGYLG